MSDDTIICSCLDITKGDVIKAIKEQNLTTVEEITDATEAGSACGACLDDIQDVLDEVSS